MLDTVRTTSVTLAGDQLLGLRWLAMPSLLATMFHFTSQTDSYRQVNLSGLSISVRLAAAALAIMATTHLTRARPPAPSAGGLCWLGAGLGPARRMTKTATT